MTRSLVTGGAGFVGAALVRALKAKGETVRVLDLARPANSDDLQGSVVDPVIARQACAGVDTVFHLAGNAQLWARDPSVFDTVNHQGTRIMAATAKAAGVRRFVHCSSLTTLVSRLTPIGDSFADENLRVDPANAIGPYPRSKILAERAVDEAVNDGLDAVIAIPTEPLGAGDAALTPPSRMILDFANSRTPASIDCVLNFVDVRSLAEGLIAARDRGRRGERYLLGGENIPMKRLLAAIETVTGVEMPSAQLPYWVALLAGLVDSGIVASITGKPPKAPLTGVRLAGRRVSFSSEKAARDLGWRSAPFEGALRDALDWFRSEGLLN